MEEVLKKFGYQEGYSIGEWKKSNWTVRFGLEKVEAFDIPRLNIPGMYYCKNLKDLTNENLEELLSEIENYIK